MENPSKRPWPHSVLALGPIALDYGLYLGPFFAILGLITGQAWMSAVAAVNWVVGYVYCAPWRAYLIRTNTPERDHEVVAALLAWASIPWSAFIFYGDAVTRPEVLRWAAPAAMAPGIVMMLVSYLQWGPPRPSLLRSLLLLSGGLVFLGWIAAYGWMARQLVVETPALLLNGASYFVGAIFLLPVPFIALWMATRLLKASLATQPAA